MSDLTLVTGPILRPLSHRGTSKSDFKNEIWSFTLLDIQVTLIGVCAVDLFIPELKHLIEKRFHGLFSKKMPLKSRLWKIVYEINLMSTSFVEKNFPDEITWITWKTKISLDIWPFLISDLETSL